MKFDAKFWAEEMTNSYTFAFRIVLEKLYCLNAEKSEHFFER